jgi:hypothetical protein
MLRVAGVFMAALGCGLALMSDAQSDSAITDRAVQIRIIIGSSDKGFGTTPSIGDRRKVPRLIVNRFCPIEHSLDDPSTYHEHCFIQTSWKP